MNWVKSNWLIIVLSVVALAALPTMYYFSSSMNKKLRATVNQAVQADIKDVSNARVTYWLPDVKKPDGKVKEVTTDVNEILTKKYAAARDAIKKESSVIGTEALKFNEGNRKPLIEGLFPKPSDTDRNRATYQFTREIIERMPQRLLDKANARSPVDPEIVGATLAEYRKAREERQKAIGNQAMDPAEAVKLTQELIAQRLDRYQSHASQVCFYADSQIFIDIPETVPNPIPPMSRLWDWQLKTWVYEDFFDAAALANSMASGGGDGNLLAGPVKRVMKISVDGPDYVDVPDESASTFSIDLSTMPPPKDPVTPDQSVSITGRYSGPSTGNQYYDLRKLTVEAIVAPKSLPLLFDALTRTNYMTVLSCDMEAIDPEKDLKEGYYYGADHVVKAKLVIETIWLRAWTKKYMPGTVRMSLNIPEDKPAEGAGDLPPQ